MNIFLKNFEFINYIIYNQLHLALGNVYVCSN